MDSNLMKWDAKGTPQTDAGVEAGARLNEYTDPLNHVKLNIFDNIVSPGWFESVEKRQISLEFLSFGESLAKGRGKWSR